MGTGQAVGEEGGAPVGRGVLEAQHPGQELGDEQQADEAREAERADGKAEPREQAAAELAPARRDRCRLGRHARPLPMPDPSVATIGA